MIFAIHVFLLKRKIYIFLSKTIQDIASYENVCRNAREALKHSLLVRGKEHLKQRNQQRNAVRKRK